jgi:hypothetical protein
MDISIFGYKLNLQFLILIGVIYLILVVHTLGGCCNYSFSEGLDTLMNSSVTSAALVKNGTNKAINSLTESFVGANTNYGQSSPYDLNSSESINTSSWSAPNMTVTPGQPLSKGVKQFLNREPQPVPPPEGELSMFATTPFKPECCPNTYSNSSGCACMTGPQYNWLIMRGGNNVPYSDY